ncbi:hypothetical protein NKH75_07065 [Mesorhizobium sp. M0984]|uniref:hypothetical protein n=1 Tax=Mesorhizobium sp. M0984 TaxID=2957041 RepID=UPI00333A7673
MTTRYAIIIEDGDGNEIVSTIGQFEGGPPQVRAGMVEKVDDGVMIGMVRGGQVDAVGGFGFPEGTKGAEGRAETIAKAGAKVLRTAKAAKGKGKAAAPAAEEPVKTETDPVE